MYTDFRQGTFTERDHLEDTGLVWWVMLKEILEKYNKKELPGLLIIIN